MAGKSRKLSGNTMQNEISNHVSTIPKIITVTSGKGGVGKTSISVNLAISLSKAGKSVLLFDADLGLANINVLLGVIPKYNLYHVLKGHKKLSEIIIQTPEGLDIIAGASGYSILANMSSAEREQMINAFDELQGYDYVIIDTGAGVNHNVVGFALPADEVLVVTTPEPTAITDAYGIIKSIVLVSPDKKVKLVVNRAASSLEGKKVAERVVNISSQFLNIKVDSIGFVFDDEAVSKSIRRQRPFVELFPKSKAAGSLKMISARLMNGNTAEDEPPEKTGGIGSFFRKLFQVTTDMP